MGAQTFFQEASGPDAESAFWAAVRNAEYEYGHNGYTGTIAEKGSFEMIKCPDNKTPIEHADDLLNDENHWINDKWGPAGCIAMGNDKFSKSWWLFFGWASS